MEEIPLKSEALVSALSTTFNQFSIPQLEPMGGGGGASGGGHSTFFDEHVPRGFPKVGSRERGFLEK